MTNIFYKVKCKDCDNEQVLFSRTSINVPCHICGTILAEPTGGKSKIKGEIIEELTNG